MGPPEESVESKHSYCPNGDKTWCKYHKDKIFNQNIYDRLKCLTFRREPEKSLCSKSRFVISVCEWNEMKWGAHGRKSFMVLLNVESGPNVIAGLKCKVQNNTRNADKCYVDYES